ncbi:MAG: nucleoside-diphosphate kinase [Holosporaceae bacterium]|nr:nucleoside-diphosphate kinase [Holosporaceae bacterium]
MLKPDAVAGGHVNAINARFERNGLHVVAQKRLRLTKEQAEKFYEIHRGKPYYESLCEYMSSGDVVVQVLAGVNAVSKNRELMGATNSATARPGTIRRDYGTDSQRNAVHGSDSDKTAEQEIALFFGELELMTGAHPVF